MERSALDWVDMINERVGQVVAFLILGIMGVMAFEVIMRYVIDKPTVWATETSGLLQMVYVMLGGGYTLLHNGHVRVDIIYAKASPRAQAIIDLTMTTILFFFFAGVLLWFGGKEALNSFLIRETSSSGLWKGQIWPFKQAVPIGTALIIIQWIVFMIRDIRVLGGKAAAAEKSAEEVSGF